MARRDVAAGTIARVAAVLGLVIVLSVGAVFALLRYWHAPPGGASPRADEALAIAAPRLQTAPQADRTDDLSHQRRQLDALQWVDRGAGIARIPVSDAMDLIAAGASR